MLLLQEQWTFPSRYDQIDHIPAHLLNKLPEKNIKISYHDATLKTRFFCKFKIWYKKLIFQSCL